MGNCMHILSCNSHKKVRVLSLNGGKEFKTSTPMSRVTSKLESGEIKQESCKRGRVKIVITRQQLELLLRNAKFQPGKVSVRFSSNFKEENRKWHPSLATIPEVPNF